MVARTALFFTILLTAATASAETTLLCFSSPTCGPCMRMQPVLRRLEREGHRLQKIDVTADPMTAQRYRVGRVPVFIVLVNGREMARLEGATTKATLQEMLSKSEQLAGMRPSPPAASAPASVVPAQHVAPQANPFPSIPTVNPNLGSNAQVASTNPQEGRIVPLQSGSAPRGRLLGVTPSKQNAGPASAEKLLRSTVKLTIEDANGSSHGTGTIVDAQQGQALVLTCGHLFRDSGGQGAISVTLFEPGPGGAVQRGTVPGKLIDYDLKRDLGLVAIRPGMPVEATAIAPAGSALAPGMATTSVGCNHGENPTVLRSQITDVDRYEGHPNVEVAGAPIEGRSGGGLFNDRGQLIGVCFAADPKGNEGLYASLPSIQARLDSLQLAKIYQSPSLRDGGASPAAAPAAVLASVDPSTGPSLDAVRGQDALQPTRTGSATLSTEERAGLEEILASAAQSEVVVIVRPKTPGGKSEVFTLRDVSPGFVEKLHQARSASAAAGELFR